MQSTPVNSHYKVAFLVLAHGEGVLLTLLLARLVEDFDVYVHIDRQSTLVLPEEIVSHPKVHLVPQLATAWGSPNLVRAQLSLFREARKFGYDRFVLISGQCVPLKSNGEIWETLRDARNAEWIDINILKEPGDEGFIDRVKRVHWHAPWRYRGFRAMVYWSVEYSLEALYRLGLPKKKPGGNLYLGEAWFALSSEAVDRALTYVDKNSNFSKLVRGSRAGDEIFFQTAVRRSSPEETRLLGPITHTDWKTGPEKPRILDQTDLPALAKSRFLFARKVSWLKSRSLVEKLYASTEERTSG